MDAMELYNRSLSALEAGELHEAQALVPLLAAKLEPLCGRGWFKLPLSGEPSLDAEIEKANRYLTG